MKTRNVVDLYRKHPLLLDVRDAKFHGKCGACDYRALCGGSRSRAFAHSNDPLGEDPACAYVPAGYVATATPTTTATATATTTTTAAVTVTATAT